MHSFVRSFMKNAEDNNNAGRGLPVFRDPNSGQINAPDSGYHSGQMSGLDMETFEADMVDQQASVIRPVASDKNLLATVSRCEDP